MIIPPTLSRRQMLIDTAVGVGAAGLLAAAPARAAAAPDITPPRGNLGDWDFIRGSWTVRHRRLKERLVGSTEWEEFNGTSTLWSTLGGAGNVDDNVIELPAGTYRAVTVRAFNPETRLWSIWWLDARRNEIDPPVRGGFRDGVGTFIGDDVHKGTPVTVRFRWSRITSNSAHWEQAFSTDRGASWEDNWHMDFTRAAG